MHLTRYGCRGCGDGAHPGSCFYICKNSLPWINIHTHRHTLLLITGHLMITGADGRSNESCFYCYCLSALIKTRSCSVHLRVLFVNQHCFFCPWCPGLAQTGRNLILKQHIYTPEQHKLRTNTTLPQGQRRVSQQVGRLRPLQSGRITGRGWRAET